MPRDIRNSRGYEYERSVTQRFNALAHWRAYRLGGSTMTIPDILAFDTNPFKINVGGPTSPPPMYAIECKTGGRTRLCIPPDQVNRCYDICATLAAYAGVPVGAFRFHSIPGRGKAARRTPKEYFVRLPHPGREYRMLYDGTLTSWLGKGYIAYKPEDVMLRMPWED